MAGCEKLSGCPMVNGNRGNSLEFCEKIKEKYCNDNNLECARYMIVREVGSDFVPQDLEPDQIEEAKEIIEECREFV